jgi:nicotinate-nucleotide adenylyltransferase
MRIGLLGGSFNPPHAGHVHISLAALKGLELDFVWWLVTPQNPNKGEAPLPLQERMALCEALIDHPHMLVSGLETDLGTTITYHTIKKLKAYYPHAEFVWISGMDNALGFHKWNHWRALLGEIAFVHLTRHPARSLVQASPLRMYARQKHRIISHAGRWPLEAGTTYWMMQKKMVNISSTEIREKSKGYKVIYRFAAQLWRKYICGGA